MKHKYLSLIALTGAMFMSTSAWAQWDEPSAPELEIKNVDAVESGKSYYIMNVGAEQFITGANNWSTQISLTTEGVVPENTDVSPALAIYVADSTGTSTNLSGVTGVSLRLDGTYTVYGASGARTFTNTYLFRDGTEDQGFMDHGTQDMGYIWKITKAENGFFRIQTAEGDPAYPDAAIQFAGWDETLGAADDADQNTIVRFNMAEDEEGACIDWMFIDAATFLVQLAAYDARVALYELLVSVDDFGYDVDTKDAGAVYNNPNATKAELEAAINDLKYAINVAEFQSQFEGATADDPLEVTDICLVNADFSEGNINGWDNTFVSGVTAVNCGYQGASYTNNGSTLEGSGGSAFDDDENASYLNGFIEAWRPNENDPHHIGDAQLSQTVFGLPTGMYKLTCDVVANQQGGYFPNPVTGVKLFIATDQGEEVYQEVATGNGNPEHFSITFTCPKGVRAMTFGLKTDNTTANWIAADNFRIYYFGETEKTLAQLNLLEAIKTAELFKDNNEGSQAYEPAREAFEAVLASAQDVADANASDEDCAAAQAALEAAKADYSASLKAYEDLANFLGYGDVPSKLDEYMDQAAKLGDLYTELEPLEAELKDGYSEGTITTERINEVINGFLDRIREYIKKGNINPGDDITILLNNPDFSEGTTSNPTGWTINNGSLTELRARTGNIETWHKTFDMSQTITDMPAGIYDITVQGFVRHDTATDTENTYFYAGDTKTCLMTLEDQWSFDPIYASDDPDHPEMGDTNYDSSMTTPDGEPAYKCNGMTGAYYWFQTEIPADLYPTFKYKAPSDQNWDGDYYYTNHIKVVLSQPGDFTIGLGTTSGTDWIIWDNFKIKYLGDDMNIYIQMINEAFAKLQETHDADEAFVTKKAEDDFNAVAKKVEDAANLQTGREALALIDEINQIGNYISAGNKAGDNLETTYYLYAEYLMPTIESTDTSFPALLSQIEASFAQPDQIADNEAIDALVAELKKGWVKYVMADHIADASAENPQDVTAAIFNPDYTDYDMNTEQQTNSEGWTNEESNGSTIFSDVYYAEIEFYNTNFNHYQTIQGLEPGWYIVANDAFYRAGDVNAMTTAYNDSVPALNSYMYAVVAGDTVATKYVHSMFDGAQIDPTYSDGEVTVNLTQEEGLNGTYYVPNLMGSAYEFLNLEDEEYNKYYNNAIIVEVKEDGVLTIGVRKTELITNDWTVITNWNLSYIGKEAPTAVESLEAKQSVKVAQFFGIDGRQQSRMQRGINIVRMVDGSVRKVMVK